MPSWTRCGLRDAGEYEGSRPSTGGRPSLHYVAVRVHQTLQENGKALEVDRMTTPEFLRLLENVRSVSSKTDMKKSDR